MASSNVDYYKRQKELQDIIHENETKRAHLDSKLKVLCKSDNRLAKLQTARLKTYWKRLTDDQKKAQQRNQQILQEFERIDQRLASSVARTEKLRLLKRQYEEYIEKAFPVWMEKVVQLKQQRQQEEDIIQQQQQEYQQRQAQQQQQLELQLLLQQQQQHAELMRQISEENSRPLQQAEGSPVIEPPRVYMDDQFQKSTHAVVSSKHSVTGESKQSASRVSSNEPQHTPAPVSQLHVGHQSRSGDVQHAAVEHDVSASEDVPDEMMSQPVQSIIVERIGQKRPGPPSQIQESPDVSKSLSGPMAPEDDGDDEDNFSEFDDDDYDDNDLPLDSRQAQPDQPLRTTVIPIPNIESEQSSPEESPAPSPVKATKNLSSSTPRPEVSVEGLMHLIKFVESDFPHALSLEGYYRSHRPSQAEKMSILQTANLNQDLSGLDAEKVSMVVLEQITLVVRGLCQCMLSESLLATSGTSLSEVQIRATLPDEAQPLWDCLFDHILKLVSEKVMVSKEAAAMFVPCLVSEYSPYQDKAYNLLISLIEKSVDRTRPADDVLSPRETLDSSLGGGFIGADGKIQVPPLKFGSLVESKQFSDEESTTMLTPSVPTDAPKVPLNETAAYRSLLTGTSQQKQPVVHIDNGDSDNTDDDVEKQFASTLSPRDPPRADNIPRVEMEPLSEASSSSHQINQDFIPTAVQLQSTKSAQGTATVPHSVRKAGIQISSDFDTDTEIDLPLGRRSQEVEKEDDDFDFYG